MGILEYVPDLSVKTDKYNIDFDIIQKECDDLLNSKEVKEELHFRNKGNKTKLYKWLKHS